MSVFNRNMIPSNLVEACFRKVSFTENGLYCHILTLFLHTSFFLLLHSQHKTLYSDGTSAGSNLDLINETEMSDTGELLPCFFSVIRI